MQQTLSTLSSKYQVVVPAQIRRALGIDAGDTLMWQVLQTGGQKKVVAEIKPKNWTKYTRGLGKVIWDNIDIDQYIKQLRAEWSQKT